MGYFSQDAPICRMYFAVLKVVRGSAPMIDARDPPYYTAPKVVVVPTSRPVAPRWQRCRGFVTDAQVPGAHLDLQKARCAPRRSHRPEPPEYQSLYQTADQSSPVVRTRRRPPGHCPVPLPPPPPYVRLYHWGHRLWSGDELRVFRCHSQAPIKSPAAAIRATSHSPLR